jgi:hypothetical protein
MLKVYSLSDVRLVIILIEYERGKQKMKWKQTGYFHEYSS